MRATCRLSFPLGGGKEIFRGIIGQNGLNDFDCKKFFLSNAPTLAVWLRGSSFDVRGLTSDEITLSSACEESLPRCPRAYCA